MTVEAVGMAWVLMNSDTPIRVYLTEDRAKEDMVLMEQTSSESDYWHMETAPLMLMAREKAEAAS